MSAPGARHVAHLVRRFAGSLRPGGPGPADEAWARQHLSTGEVALWVRMSGPDRRHAVAVARRVAATLGPASTGPVVAAALLHDVGKISSGLGTVGRVLATVASAAVGRRRARRWDGPVGRYLAHPELGAALLVAAGSDELTVAWTREHHRAPERWTVPRPVADVLKAADGD